MVVQCFLPVGFGHGPSRPRNLYEWCPECLDNFTLDLAGTWDEVWRVPRVTRILMTMHVEEANTFVNLYAFRHVEVWAPIKAFQKMNTVLTHDVIHQKNPRSFGHVVVQSRGQGVIHIFLLFSFLEIHHGCWDKAAMPSAGSSPNAGGIELMPISVCLVDSPVIAASGSLTGRSPWHAYIRFPNLTSICS